MKEIIITRKEFAHEGKLIALTDNCFVTDVTNMEENEERDSVELYVGEEYDLCSDITKLQLTTYVGNEAKFMYVDPDTRSVTPDGEVTYTARVITVEE